MSKQSSAELIQTITEAVVLFQEATDRLDAAAATHLGVNRTDLLCIGLLLRTGGMTAGELATASGLSPAATTAAIERLEAGGYATRSRDDTDRRRVLVQPTQRAETRCDRVFSPVQQAGVSLLGKYSRTQLETIKDFLAEGADFQDRQTDRIRKL